MMWIHFFMARVLKPFFFEREFFEIEIYFSGDIFC